ncbi:MAG TPA: hypothetical protein VHN13_08520 [Candidatus Tectomicrobia bacterium]|jgi:hypothetical protein|nr:hypothetical protein [Candidatus Tectomicrobia bacterium]
MVDGHLATYLNDHLAGAVAAIELLTHIEAAHAGTATARFFAELRADVEGDRQELEALMGRLHVTVSRSREVIAFFAEKAAQLKLRLDDSAGGALRLLEVSEAVALGIEGKRALWRTLAAAAEVSPALQVADYERLTQRAEEQRQRVETVRLEAARAAFTAAP